jgi:hypothetical protein
VYVDFHTYKTAGHRNFAFLTPRARCDSRRFLAPQHEVMGSNHKVLFRHVLARTVDAQREYPVCPLLQAAEQVAAESATQTDLTAAMVQDASGGFVPDVSANVAPPKLPSVDEFECDADAVEELDFSALPAHSRSPPRDAQTLLLRDPSALGQAAPRDADTTPVVVWTIDMAETQFGVVPVVELDDFLL